LLGQEAVATESLGSALDMAFAKRVASNPAAAETVAPSLAPANPQAEANGLAPGTPTTASPALPKAKDAPPRPPRAATPDIFDDLDDLPAGKLASPKYQREAQVATPLVAVGNGAVPAKEGDAHGPDPMEVDGVDAKPDQAGAEAPAADLEASGGISDEERRILGWHWANLEYGCSARLDQVSLAHWNQVRRHLICSDLWTL
jgi:hypothetical protein